MAAAWQAAVHGGRAEPSLALPQGKAGAALTLGCTKTLQDGPLQVLISDFAAQVVLENDLD